MIDIQGITKTFRRERGREVQEFRALDDVSLKVRDQEFISIIGPSGCGKTTLLRVVAGLIPYDEGAVLIDGTPITGPGDDRAMVFQTFALLPWRDVLGNVEFGLELRGVAAAQRKSIAREFINLVGLGGFEHHYIHELSGGMQQRAGFARALAVNPRILLMDEPFGALDAQTRLVLQDDLMRIWEKEQKTVIFITHAMDEAIYLSDRVVIMSSRPGRIREVLDINIPRPRTAATRAMPEFAELTGYIWDRLQSGAREATAV